VPSEATKAAGRLGLPIFVVRYAGGGGHLRDVYRGWVEDWDDASKLFLIAFGDEPPPPRRQPADEDPFVLTETDRRARREVLVRPGQQRFQFRVFQRYGPACAVCGLAIRELLEAAHICGKKAFGTDDARNGLVLCSLHHRAFDAGLFGIAPSELVIQYRAKGPTANELRVTVPNLLHLRYRPHSSAVEWHWEHWRV
jgi:hypothetical protein